MLRKKKWRSHSKGNRGALPPLQVPVDIVILGPCHPNGNDWRSGFQSEERRTCVAFLQPSNDRLPAFRRQRDDAAFRQAIQGGTDGSAVWLAAVDPDDAIGTKD